MYVNDDQLTQWWQPGWMRGCMCCCKGWCYDLKGSNNLYCMLDQLKYIHTIANTFDILKDVLIQKCSYPYSNLLLGSNFQMGNQFYNYQIRTQDFQHTQCLDRNPLLLNCIGCCQCNSSNQLQEYHYMLLAEVVSSMLMQLVLVI